MKIWKLVSGILNIVFFALVIMQSCAAGISNALESNGEIGGTGGLILSIMLLTGGIVSIVTRKNEKRGGNIALIVLYALGALSGYIFAESYSDLRIWASWCFICLIMADISLIMYENKHKTVIKNTIPEREKQNTFEDNDKEKEE